METEQNQGAIRVRRGMVESVCVYEVKEEELETIQNGSSGGLFLNIALTLLSFGFSTLLATLLTKIESDRVFIVFVALIIITILLGVVFLILWYRDYKSVSLVFNKIRARVPDEVPGDANESQADESDSFGAVIRHNLFGR